VSLLDAWFQLLKDWWFRYHVHERAVSFGPHYYPDPIGQRA